MPRRRVAKLHLSALNAWTYRSLVYLVAMLTFCEPLAQLGVNGFGRVGMLVFRTTSPNPDVKVVAVNDPFGPRDYLVYQLKYACQFYESRCESGRRQGPLQPSRSHSRPDVSPTCGESSGDTRGFHNEVKTSESGDDYVGSCLRCACVRCRRWCPVVMSGFDIIVSSTGNINISILEHG